MVVALLTLSAFLVVLALLAGHLRASATAAPARRVVVIRKVYRTTVVEKLVGGSGPNGTSVTQSVSGSSAAGVSSSAPTTRTS